MWKPLIEIAILWFIIYRVILFFEGTRAMQVLRGIGLILIAFFLFEKLNLTVIDWLFTKLFGISIIALLVIFHPEIRQGLARIGRRNLFSASLRAEELEAVLKEIAAAAETLAKNKMGALIALEKSDSLAAYVPGGVAIDARISSDLIEAVFTPNNPLHDGGMIIQHGRISSAGCLFPLVQDSDLSRVFGTRHRAALGLSEETDALIIVVSEERQDISLVYKAKLYKDLGREELIQRIKEFTRPEKKNAPHLA